MRYSIKHYMHHEATGGVVLMLAALMALVLTNSGWNDSYQAVLNAKIALGLRLNGTLYGLEKPLFLWINDGLMTLFFLMVGLEIKREVSIGELSTKAKALQPVFAALGGMILPALIFVALNAKNADVLRGWAIPCATDIAFALGVLALLGARVPLAIKVLLTAIAILDDLAAILIIAFFYTHDVALFYVLIAGAGAVMLAALNRFHVQRIAPYIVFGAVMWTGLLKAGIHPTLAGVATALAIPLDEKKKENAPLMKLEHALHPWIVFGVLPIFALANAGLSFKGLSVRDLGQNLSLGVAAGLAVGKPLGIMGGLWIGHKTGLAAKPPERRWCDYVGVAFLCGIGFTMALFIGDLAFENQQLVNEAKLGILSASLLSAVIGWIACRAIFARPSS